MLENVVEKTRMQLLPNVVGHLLVGWANQAADSDQTALGGRLTVQNGHQHVSRFRTTNDSLTVNARCFDVTCCCSNTPSWNPIYWLKVDNSYILVSGAFFHKCLYNVKLKDYKKQIRMAKGNHRKTSHQSYESSGSYSDRINVVFEEARGIRCRTFRLGLHLRRRRRRRSIMAKMIANAVTEQTWSYSILYPAHSGLNFLPDFRQQSANNLEKCWSVWTHATTIHNISQHCWRSYKYVNSYNFT